MPSNFLPVLRTKNELYLLALGEILYRIYATLIHIAVGGPPGLTPDGGKILMFHTQPVKQTFLVFSFEPPLSLRVCQN